MISKRLKYNGGLIPGKFYFICSKSREGKSRIKIQRNNYGFSGDIYEISDEEFRDKMTKRKYKNGKISKEDAFVDLI